MKCKIIICFVLAFFVSLSFGQSRENTFKFLPNQGQWQEDIRYRVELPEGDLYVFDQKLRYEFYNPVELKKAMHQHHGGKLSDSLQQINGHAFEIYFDGSQVPEKIIGLEAYTEKRNYIYPSGTYSNVSCFNKIRFKNLYQGVDLVLFQKDGTLKYEFIVSPRVETSQIKLRFDGQESLYLESGFLITKTSVNAIAERAPYAYQILGDIYEEVECEFNLSDNIISYNLGKYHHKDTLVIDPQLIFSTYSGSTADNWGNTACLDNKGNLYTGGTIFKYKRGTSAPSGMGQFPATVGAFQTSFQGGDTDIGILKFDSSGVHLQYATYIGGSGTEIPTSTITNDKGELFILGVTSSSDMPVSANAFQTNIFSLGTYLDSIYWYLNGNIIDTGLIADFLVNEGDSLYVTMPNPVGCGGNSVFYSNDFVIPENLEKISFLTEPYFCTGDDSLFIVVSPPQANIIEYNWSLNGVTQVVKNNVFSLQNPKQGDSVISSIKYVSCTGDTLLISDTLVAQDATGLTPSINIIDEPSMYCTNQSYVISPETTLGGLNPIIKWYYDNSLIYANTNASTVLLDTVTIVRIELISALTCLANNTALDSLKIDTIKTNDSPQIILTNYDCSQNAIASVKFDYLATGSSYIWSINGIAQPSTFFTQKNFTNIKPKDTIAVSIATTSGCVDLPATDTIIVSKTTPLDQYLDITVTSFCKDSLKVKALISIPSKIFKNVSTVGGYSFKNVTDLIVLQLSADGSQILNGTYIGGADNDGLVFKGESLTLNYGDQLRGDINIDSSGNVYVASTTRSQNFPVKNGVQMSYGGGTTDAVLFKLKADFSDLEWSTYIGGSEMETGLSVKRDSADNVFIVGGTMSDDFVTTKTLSGYNLGGGDAYLLGVSADGQSLLQSVKYGTPEMDEAYFLEIDDEGSLYVLGQSFGQYPVKNVRYSNPKSGLFIQKFSRDIGSPLFSTVIGDLDSTNLIRPNLSPTAFLVNECHNMFISGWGGSTNANYPSGGALSNMPLTSNAFQKTTDGSDFYMMALLENSDSLLYSTYFGGPTSREHVDGGTSRFDNKGIVYQSVCAGCGGNKDFPLFPSVDNDPTTYPKNNNSKNCNNGVFKFDLASLDARIGALDSCNHLTVTFDNKTIGGASYIWNFGDNSPEISYTDKRSVTHTFPVSGTYKVQLKVSDLTTCTRYDSTEMKITVHEKIDPQNYNELSCIGGSLSLSVQTYPEDLTYNWSPSTGLSDSTIHNPVLTNIALAQQTYEVLVIDSIGCKRTDIVNVKAIDLKADAEFDIIGQCQTDGFPKIVFKNLTAEQFPQAQFPQIKYTWDFGDGNTSKELLPIYSYNTQGSFTVKLSVKMSASCQDTIQISVPIQYFKVPNIITPNGDDKNEAFVIEGIQDNGDWGFEFYNRWGKLLYDNKAYDNTYEAKEISDGVYYYLITAPDGSKCKNWVTITR